MISKDILMFSVFTRDLLNQPRQDRPPGHKSDMTSGSQIVFVFSARWISQQVTEFLDQLVSAALQPNFWV